MGRENCVPESDTRRLPHTHFSPSPPHHLSSSLASDQKEQIKNGERNENKRSVKEQKDLLHKRREISEANCRVSSLGSLWYKINLLPYMTSCTQVFLELL